MPSCGTAISDNGGFNISPPPLSKFQIKLSSLLVFYCEFIEAQFLFTEVFLYIMTLSGYTLNY